MPEYEGTIIRPPSEAESLILQYTIGCSHNECIFCPAYKQKLFRIRSIEEMEKDILDCAPAFNDTRRVFLADGDALSAPQQDILTLFALLRRYFSRLRRIGMYANTRSILDKSVDELSRLREQGLGILYLGVESGDDTLLAWMQKGVTAEETMEASRRVKKAGIKLSVTVLLGIGGSTGSIQHARATGKLLTEIEPDYVGALTTMVVRGTPLYLLQESGNFTMPDSFAILNELAEMIEHTEMRGLFFANHASNYMPLQVRMPLQREETITMIREFVRKGDPSFLKPERLRRL
ncbi:MAG: oxygen-independent coproporphyrinogen III oxidase Fe-S oxidoreductase [Nitrospirae bacterium]|nr:MAG: oxygen-independent coproporphyrinogen III oxidase Fe-S oxidoreductase [Nitrospirota bacterium]